MKLPILWMAATSLLAAGPALADRVAGIAGLPPARAASAPVVPPAPWQHGTVSALRDDGTQVQIDGKWYRLKPGRSLLLRGGRPVGAESLAMGQKLKFSLASTTPGEAGLGVVHVP